MFMIWTFFIAFIVSFCATIYAWKLNWKLKQKLKDEEEITADFRRLYGRVQNVFEVYVPKKFQRTGLWSSGPYISETCTAIEEDREEKKRLKTLFEDYHKAFKLCKHKGIQLKKSKLFDPSKPNMK